MLSRGKTKKTDFFIFTFKKRKNRQIFDIFCREKSNQNPARMPDGSTGMGNQAEGMDINQSCISRSNARHMTAIGAPPKRTSFWMLSSFGHFRKPEMVLPQSFTPLKIKLC